MGLPQVQRICDDERVGCVQEDEDVIDDFIDYEEEAGGMGEQGHEEKEHEREKGTGNVGGPWVTVSSC